jgi:splicing factor 3B subunit 5
MQTNIKEEQTYKMLKGRYVGLGNADSTREEFIANIKRDTYSSLIGHDSLLTQLSVGLNRPKEIIKHDFIDKMAKS